VTLYVAEPLDRAYLLGHRGQLHDVAGDGERVGVGRVASGWCSAHLVNSAQSVRWAFRARGLLGVLARLLPPSRAGNKACRHPLTWGG
jgi:hypothetical protein